MAILRWNRVSNLEPSGPEAKTSPPVRRGHMSTSHKEVTPTLPGSSEERSPRQQSETEVGVPTAITGHRPTSPEGGISHLWNGGNSISHRYFTHEENENPLTYPATSHPNTC
ncbi:hypothetical protein AVEN_114455-1 [Araneus ventricosus]|uniref:Uncharacterized protein n=1 Tax=Araneus ventricosus TaxID=182803 RepID=A0A4Y2U2R9_ARAVE|nr:hypothetical protein AVEN_114455-1 [Araneus ventricosus]